MCRLLLVLGLALSAGSARAQDDGPDYYFNPDWSPDGDRIVFESGRGQHFSIYTIGVDGNDLTRLTNDDYNDEGPVWSPDGSQIAFFSNRRERRDELPVSLQIYIMNADGSGQRRITNDGPALEYNISWSPDGDRLAFQSRPEINPGVHSLYIIGTDGMARQRITDGRYSDASPQWSPDGNLILFTQSPALYKFFGDLTPEERTQARASAEIMVLNLEDGTQTPVTQNTVQDIDPSWSADGSKIYYLQDDGQKRTFFRQTVGQTDAIAVADSDVVFHSRPPTRTRVSPNGRFLVYHNDVNGVYGIYDYDLEREQERRLVGGSAE